MCGNAITIVCFLNNVNKYILNPLLALGFALAFLYFIYSVVRFLRLDAADKSREEARNAILWGMFGMLIMFSVYGIIQFFILPTFGLSPNDLSKSPGAQQFLKLDQNL